MKTAWTQASGVAIGADWLLAAIAPAGTFGRRARSRERPFRRGDEIAARAALARVERLAHAVPATRLSALRTAIAQAPDLAAVFVRARSGETLADVDFFELGRLLDALAEVCTLAGDAAFAYGAGDAAFAHGAGDAAFALRAALAPGRTPSRTFYLADGFDAELAARRRASAAAQASYDGARSRLAARVCAYAGLESVRDGEFVLMRDAVPTPLPPEIRVVREAPTYVLCEIALDARALAALSARDAADTSVADAEEAVRTRLSAHVARAAEELESACDGLGELDALVARAEFAQRYACVLPEVVEDASVSFVDARYLPLAQLLGTRGRRYAPISLDLDGMGVVTGANMGGKTAALRTLGFIAACVALGVPVPAASACVPLLDEIVWLGIGATAESDGLLSAFGREVVELRTFLARDARRALVLVDEFARTTSPREGRALLVALLEILRERGACGLAATHLARIAADAGVAHFAIGGLGDLAPGGDVPLELDAALARIARAMDYRLARVDERAVPAADAIALAEALGLDGALVARAREAL